MLAKIEAASYRWNRLIVTIVGGSLFMGMTFLLLFESARRTIMATTTWGLYETIEIIVAWLVFTALAYALITNYHVRVTLVLDRLPIRARIGCEIFVSLIGVILFGFLLYGAIPHAWDSFLLKETPMSPARTPLWLAKMAVPVGVFIMLVQFIIRFMRTVRPTREVIERVIEEEEKVVGF